jgi:hypothetical protein
VELPLLERKKRIERVCTASGEVIREVAEGCRLALTTPVRPEPAGFDGFSAELDDDINRVGHR